MALPIKRGGRSSAAADQAWRPLTRFGIDAISSCARSKKYGFLRWPSVPAIAAAAVELTGILRYTGRSQMRGPTRPGLLAPGWAGAYSSIDQKSTPDVHHIR